jgi:nucleotide-binding universal stress UspA family protein
MKIVVHVDTGESWPRRVEAAAKILANHGGGRILGLFGQMASTLPSYSFHGDKDVIDRDAAPHKARFLEILAAYPTLEVEWHTIHSVNPGFIVTEITANAQFADLTVLGQIDPRATAERTPADMAEQVVLNCGRPVMLIPYTGTFDYDFKRVLIAYNDSRESSRAVGDALPFIKGSKARVEVVRHAPEKADPSDWRWVELSKRLADHGVDATVETPAIANIGVADFLLSQAADVDAQLLVMGAYGKLGLPRMLRGSVTRDVLRQMTLPVLLSH